VFPRPLLGDSCVSLELGESKFLVVTFLVEDVEPLLPPTLVRISEPEVEIPNIRSNGEAEATNNVSSPSPPDCLLEK
jgi:hypothetical protein